MHTISEFPFDGYLHVSSTANITTQELGRSLSAQSKVFRGVQTARYKAGQLKKDEVGFISVK